MRVAALPRPDTDVVPTVPRRLVRSRKKGAKTAPGAFYCGRPTIRSNPFSWRRFGFARSYRLFCDWFDGRIGALTLERLGYCPAEIDALFRRRAKLRAQLPFLRGRNLECWCHERCPWCHVGHLLRRANAPEIRL